MKTFIAIWIIGGILSFGMTTAWYEAKGINYMTCREQVAFVGLFSAIPIAPLFLSFFASGFAENGLKYTCPR